MAQHNPTHIHWFIYPHIQTRSTLIVYKHTRMILFQCNYVFDSTWSVGQSHFKTTKFFSWFHTPHCPGLRHSNLQLVQTQLTRGFHRWAKDNNKWHFTDIHHNQSEIVITPQKMKTHIYKSRQVQKFTICSIAILHRKIRQSVYNARAYKCHKRCTFYNDMLISLYVYICWKKNDYQHRYHPKCYFHVPDCSDPMLSASRSGLWTYEINRYIIIRN